MMNIDLKKLVRASDFKPEDKKNILENFDKLSPEAVIDLWQICLENLQWKLEIEFSKRFHESVFKGVIEGKDNTNYQQLEKDILLEIFTKAEVEVRHEEIETVRKTLQNLKSKPLTQDSVTPSPTQPSSGQASPKSE